MVSHSTYLMVKDVFLLRELDLLRVKGKQVPVRVYELIGRLDEDPGDNLKKTLEIYDKGLEAYREMEW